MDRYAYQDAGAGEAFPVGSRVSYRVEPVNRRGRVGPAATVTVDLGPGPAPPTGVSARPGDGVVELSWSPATGVPPARGYNVYRGSQPGAYGEAPLNTSPLLETRFQDSTVSNGVTYYYVVRAVGGDEPPFREGKNSAEVAIAPEDRTAPPPPTGLAAVPFAGGVALAWDPNTEADLQGYQVYRREQESAASTRLTPSPIPATMFTDRSTRPGATYLYSVTAVDRSPRHNESVPSAEVEARLP
jgi:fibronectin type 3 domain-containing protein